MTSTFCVTPLLVAALLCIHSEQAASKEFSNEAKEKCIGAINQRTAAFVAEDWAALEKRANAYLTTCNGAFGDQNLSEAIEQLAISNIALNRPSDGLNQAQLCIETYYSNSSCHVQKVIALIALRRTDEARRSLVGAIKLILHNIESTERELVRPLDALDRELLESNLKMFNAQLGHARALQEKLSIE